VYKIYDNVLPKETFEFFKSQCVDNVSWDFVENSAYRQSDIKNLEIIDSKNKYSFARTVFGKRDGSKLPEFEVCVANITFMLADTGVSINGLKRIRFGLLTGSDKKIVNTPHVDFYEPHITGLFYFDNSDGETVFYNKIHNLNMNPNEVPKWVTTWENDPACIETKVESKENRLVLFNGLNYHSSTRPTNVSKRVTMNFNIFSKQ
jgi:hypothetical protein